MAARKLHGMSRTRTYKTWWHACRVGACERWQNFTDFLADMGEQPDGLILGRFHGDYPFAPENCAWMTAEEARRTWRKRGPDRKPRKRW